LEEPRGKRALDQRGRKVRITADFSSETLQAGREWNEIFKRLKEKPLT
jgi:hypothetical protein